jgi:hypothetical protein
MAWNTIRNGGTRLDSTKQSAPELLKTTIGSTGAIPIRFFRATSHTSGMPAGTFRNLNAILNQAGLVAARVEDLSRNMDAAAARQGKYWEAIQEKAIASLDRLNNSADALTALLTNTDNSINGRLVPAAAESLDSIEALTQEAFGDLSEASGRANDSLDDIHRLLSDPAWTAALDPAQPDFQCGGASIFLRRSYESISADRCRTEETVGDHRIAEGPKCCRAGRKPGQHCVAHSWPAFRHQSRDCEAQGVVLGPQIPWYFSFSSSLAM